jgi:anti-sigma factor RsiW
MSTNYTHQDIVELLGAFALDAVDDDERDVIEAHLAGCPRCRAEVEGHRETAALLAHSGERAPEGVWDRIADALDEAPPALDLTRLTHRRHARRTIPLRVAAATMAVAAAVTLLLGVALGRNDDGLGRFDKVADAMEKALVANAANAALANPQAEQVQLTATDGKASARVVRLPDGTGYLLPANLAPLPAGRFYQLWAVRSDAKISLGVLGGVPEISAFRMNGPVVAYAVTEEAAGGVAQTQNQPVIVGYLKA